MPLGERWELLANWTNNEATDTTDQPRCSAPRTSATSACYIAGPTSGSLSSRTGDVSRDALDSSGAPLPDYEVLDLSVSYDTSETLEIFGRVQNATDETYEEVVGYNTPERSVYGGVRLRF